MSELKKERSCNSAKNTTVKGHCNAKNGIAKQGKTKYVGENVFEQNIKKTTDYTKASELPKLLRAHNSVSYTTLLKYARVIL